MNPEPCGRPELQLPQINCIHMSLREQIIIGNISWIAAIFDLWKLYERKCYISKGHSCYLCTKNTQCPLTVSQWGRIGHARLFCGDGSLIRLRVRSEQRTPFESLPADTFLRLKRKRCVYYFFLNRQLDFSFRSSSLIQKWNAISVICERCRITFYCL